MQKLSVFYFSLLFLSTLSGADIEEAVIEAVKRNDIDYVADQLRRCTIFPDIYDDEEDWYILHEAVVGKRYRITELLLMYTADHSCKNPRGMTPLHLAAKSGNTEIASLLMLYGARADQEDDLGCTPLHYANTKNMVQRLLFNVGIRRLLDDQDDGRDHGCFKMRYKQQLATIIDPKLKTDVKEDILLRIELAAQKLCQHQNSRKKTAFQYQLNGIPFELHSKQKQKRLLLLDYYDQAEMRKKAISLFILDNKKREALL